MAEKLQDPQEAGGSEADEVTQTLLGTSETPELQPEPEAEGETKVTPEPEPTEQTLLADKFQTQDDLVKGYKESERMAHDATQKAAELQRRLDAAQQSIQPPIQQPQEVALSSEQLTELMYSDTPKYHEYMQRQAEKRTQQMMQPLLQFATDQRLKEMRKDYPGFQDMEPKITQTMQELAAGKGDIGELAYLVEMGKQAQELQAKARQDGTNAAYATQQQKVAAQPPSGKAHSQSTQTISSEEDKVRHEFGMSEDEWLKYKTSERGE